ncbi:MAG: hypothetical protein Q8R72_08950 [Hylemonella sp.]|nr:hypothetical protein [Hylemonella sp.]
MIFAWFDASEAKKFGGDLAKFFLERVPRAIDKSDKQFAQKVDAALAKMLVQIVQFTREHSLNTYKKAQLANEFKWTLLDAGIPPDYADDITKWLTQKVG